MSGRRKHYNECFINGVFIRSDLASNKRTTFADRPGIDYLGKTTVYRTNGGAPMTIEPTHFWKRRDYDPKHPAIKLLLLPNWVEKAVTTLARSFQGRTKQ